MVGINSRRSGVPYIVAVGLVIGTGLVGCSGNRSIGASGTLPPIRTTTTLGPTQTTVQPYFLHYRLQRGETLAVVANAFGMSVTALIEFNRERLGDNPNRVGVGTEIVIPPQRWIDALPPPTSEGDSVPDSGSTPASTS